LGTHLSVARWLLERVVLTMRWIMHVDMDAFFCQL